LSKASQLSDEKLSKRKLLYSQHMIDKNTLYNLHYSIIDPNNCFLNFMRGSVIKLPKVTQFESLDVLRLVVVGRRKPTCEISQTKNSPRAMSVTLLSRCQ